MRLVQSDVSDNFSIKDFNNLLSTTTKSDQNEINYIKNNLVQAFKTFPSSAKLPKGLNGTITITTTQSNLDQNLKNLTDIFVFVEPNCNFDHQALADQYTPNDYSLNNSDSQLQLNLINAREAWYIEKGSPSVLIGMTDSGILENHEDLENKIHTILHNSTNKIHGTFVAGLAAAHTNNDKGVASIGFNTKLVFSATGFRTTKFFN